MSRGSSRRVRLAVGLSMTAASIGCGSDVAGRSGTDAAAAPVRVLSLVPSTTDLIVALGQSARLVGRTDFDRDASIARLPSVGNMIDPSIEAIISLRPDLVIVWRDSGLPRIDAKLRALGIRTESVGASSLADLRSAIARLGLLLSAGASADSLAKAIADTLASVRRSTAHLPRRRVFYVVWHNPVITTGPGTFIDSLIAVAGGVNIFSDARGDWPTIAFEQVVARDPDVVVWPLHAGQSLRGLLRSDHAWSKLRAVRTGRTIAVDADLLNRPDSRIGAAARMLAVAFHGKRVDVESTLTGVRVSH